MQDMEKQNFFELSNVYIPLLYQEKFVHCIMNYKSLLYNPLFK